MHRNTHLEPRRDVLAVRTVLGVLAGHGRQEAGLERVGELALVASLGQTALSLLLSGFGRLLRGLEKVAHDVAHGLHVGLLANDAILMQAVLGQTRLLELHAQVQKHEQYVLHRGAPHFDAPTGQQIVQQRHGLQPLSQLDLFLRPLQRRLGRPIEPRPEKRVRGKKK